MSLIAVIIGIFINLRCVASTTGVIDISDPRSKELFSGPTKIGNAQFYKYTCKDNGSYSNVFDKDFQFFPLRAHTRLVNIVLACREKEVELLQLMYCDVKKDLRLNNLYYRKSEDTWTLIDQATYKSELFNLKNNYVSFQLNDEEHFGFKKVKSEEEDGYDSYVLEEEYEIDKVYENKLVVWESDPNYTFKSLDLAKTKDDTEQLRIQFSNYFSEVSQFYKISGGRWVLDIGRRTVDLRSLYTHGSERNEGHGSSRDEESDSEYMESFMKEYYEESEYEEPVTIMASDLCDVEMGFGEVEFNLSFTRGKNPEMTVRYYTTYEISNYEFLNLRGVRMNSIKDGDWQILDTVEDEQLFYNAKLSFVPDHDVATVALTSIRMKEGACDSEKKLCKISPFGFKHFFHKKKATVWSCLEQFPYYYEMNTLMEVASQLMMKRMFESPPVTPTHVPSTMYLDYGGKEPFTYEINNPFENRITHEILHTEPDFIRLRPKEGTVMNALVDGSSLLWEQREVGNGVLMIYVYKSEENLVAHMVVDSKTEPHVFIKQYKGRWHIIDKDEYESLKDVPLWQGQTGLFKKRRFEGKIVDEYSLDPDAEIAPELSDSESGLPSEAPESESADADDNSADTETKVEASEKLSDFAYLNSDALPDNSHHTADSPHIHGSTGTAHNHGSDDASSGQAHNTNEHSSHINSNGHNSHENSHNNHHSNNNNNDVDNNHYNNHQNNHQNNNYSHNVNHKNHHNSHNMAHNSGHSNNPDSPHSHHNSHNPNFHSYDHHSHITHNPPPGNPHNSNPEQDSDFEFYSEDDPETTRPPVKIKRSSISPPQGMRSVTIELSDESESEDERGSQPFEGDEL